MTPGIRRRRSRRSCRCVRRRARRTCWWCCSTTSGSGQQRVGGQCRTPTAERLAAAGLKYNRFHTTALCSPTRAALLSGRNHHSVGMGGITEIATSAPGYNSLRPNRLRPAGGDVAAQRVRHGAVREVPRGAGVGVQPAGPVGSVRPCRGTGSSTSSGSSAARRTSGTPSLYENTVAIEPHKTPEEGYHFTEDMTDRTIAWIRSQKALTPDKPFFVSTTPGATHAPHHVPVEWAEKYRGQLDQGWDRVREETLERQRALGVVPPDCELTARSDGIPAWVGVPDTLKPVLAREMEVYAGFLEHTDHHFGRLIDALETLGALDDTLVIYILGDNGASAEGTMRGTFGRTSPGRRSARPGAGARTCRAWCRPRRPARRRSGWGRRTPAPPAPWGRYRRS